MIMTRFAIALLSLTSLVFAAHTYESAGAPPAGIDPAISALLQKEGVRIKDGDKNVMELWFVNELPKGEPTSQPNVSLTTIPHGSLMGVVRFADRGQDRRGQTLKPGVYTLRLSYFPPDGNHQGVSEQRDFLLMSPADSDKDPKATPDFETLVDWSTRVSGTAHPAILSVWKTIPDNYKGGVVQEGEHDWVLQHKIGDTAVSVIVAGVAAH